MKKIKINKNLIFRYLFEIVVIIFSITASFYIQDLLNNRDKEDNKNRGLEGILIELKKDKQFFHFGKNYNKQRLSYIDSLFDLSFSFNPLYISGMWGNFELFENKNFFNALVSTGSLEFIKNKELQSELNNYYNGIYTILNTAIETDNRSFLRFGDKLTDYKMDSINYGTIEGNLTKHYFDPSDIIKIRKDKKLKSIALDWSMYMRMQSELMTEGDKKIETLEKLIEEELNK
tara:strand:+ start:98 stop:793 length:696 start_codon:yes stop_codon:yes gene_type:complete